MLGKIISRDENALCTVKWSGICPECNAEHTMTSKDSDAEFYCDTINVKCYNCNEDFTITAQQLTGAIHAKRIT